MDLSFANKLSANAHTRNDLFWLWWFALSPKRGKGSVQCNRFDGDGGTVKGEDGRDESFQHKKRAYLSFYRARPVFIIELPIDLTIQMLQFQKLLGM